MSKIYMQKNFEVLKKIMDPEQREKLQKKLGIDRRDEQRDGLLFIY